MSHARRLLARAAAASLVAAAAGAPATAAAAGEGAPERPLAGPPAASAAATRGPVVKQLLVRADGSTALRTVRASAATVRVRGRRCAVAAGTPLAALVRSRVASLGLRDFGRCSSRARDAGQLFVDRIGATRSRGLDGWVYKVGTRAGTAGAGDPSGPFGRGRLRRGAELTWFYCRLDPATQSCQRTLRTRAAAAGYGGGVTVSVRAHDDAGRSVPGAGALVSVGAATALADAEGVARLVAAPGRQRVRATLDGAVPAFPRTVTIG